MSEGIICALITGGLALAGVIITKRSGDKELISKIKEENAKALNNFKLEVTKNQAITDTKIEELTREVRLHNNFAQRVPVLENEMVHVKEEIKEYHK